MGDALEAANEALACRPGCLPGGGPDAGRGAVRGARAARSRWSAGSSGTRPASAGATVAVTTSSTTFIAITRPATPIASARTSGPFTRSPITSRRDVSHTSGTTAKGRTSDSTTWLATRVRSVLAPSGDHDQRRDHGDQPADEDRDLPVHEAVDDHLPGQASRPWTRRGPRPGARSRTRPVPASPRSGPSVAWASSIPEMSAPTWKKTAEAMITIEALIRNAPFMASAMSISSRRKCSRLLSPSRMSAAVLDEPGVQVDDVGHDGRADHGDGDVDRARLDARHEHAVQDAGGVGIRDEDLDDERGADHGDERHDRDLEAHVAVALHREQREGDDRGQERRREQAEPEQDLHADGGAEELGQVGRHGGCLGRQPEPDPHPPGRVGADRLRQRQARRDAELGRERLDEDRHQVRGDEHPQEHVAEVGAGLDVGGEVARGPCRPRWRRTPGRGRGGPA